MALKIRQPDFGSIAAVYDELRPLDPEWLELYEEAVKEGDLLNCRALDVGCGTGRLAAMLAAQGADAWGVEPAPDMAERARKRLGNRLAEGKAESLPFPPESFDRVVMWRVVHLIDRPAAFAEIFRVLAPGGRLVVVTLDPVCLGGYWLNRFFPSIEKIDQARYPRPETLAAELTDASFASVRLSRLRQRVRVAREVGLQRVRNRFMSTLLLLDDAEYSEGLELIERELPQLSEYDDEWAIAVGHRR